MTERRIALDGSHRRRLYLFRHGAVDYIDADGIVVPDPDAVSLNTRGIKQAHAMRELFRDVHVDRVICSGLRRTVETATTVLGERDYQLEIVAELAEIRALRGSANGEIDLLDDIAFSHWRAVDEGSRFLGGERYADFFDRVSAAMDTVLQQPDWHNLAIFAHGGTNAAVIGWATGLDLKAFGLVDQATCCLNIIDFDWHSDKQHVVRKTLRAMNITADDPVMRERHSGDMEALANLLMTRAETET